MKIKIVFFISSVFVVSQVAIVPLADASAQQAGTGTPAHKFVRGLEGTVTSPLEYINQYQLASHQHGLIASVAGSVLGGTATTLKRILNGVYDIVSFPVNVPKNYGLLFSDESETALQAYISSQNSSSFPLGKQAI